jgi:glycosyltransferase involved in cell wall biosynthesis
MTLVEEIMPRVWAQRPDVRLYIVGKDPPPAITHLDPEWSPDRRPPAIDDGQGRIVVTGRVEHVPPYLQQATLAVAPVPYGAGIQNKVLEAMACGAPVVASPQAASALDAQSGRDLRIAEDADAFAAALLELLDDPQERERLSRAGRAYVEKHHSWDAITKELVAVYLSAIEASAPQPPNLGGSAEPAFALPSSPPGLGAGGPTIK